MLGFLEFKQARADMSLTFYAKCNKASLQRLNKSVCCEVSTRLPLIS